MIRVGILGSKGKMGEAVARTIQARYSDRTLLFAQVDQITDGDSFDKLLEADLVIDFSSPAAMVSVIEASGKCTKLPSFIIGTTGWKIDDRRKLEDFAKKTPVLMSANFSIGVMAVLDAIKVLAPFLDHFKYEPVIIETHHKHKKDSPSGTAVSLQRAIATKGPGNVPIQSIRAGEVVGDHEVRFYGQSDEIVIRHAAYDRSVFAEGAVEAGFWLLEKKKTTAPSALLGIEAYFQDIKGKLR